MQPEPDRSLSHLLFIAIVAVLLTVTAAGCGNQKRTLILATTTSTHDTGLLDRILPEFERRANLKVKVIAVGTGEALALGEKGNADVVLVHAPRLEKQFVRAGFGTGRRRFMHNFFVLLGPSDDPAKIAGVPAKQALKRIAGAEALFVSRGDNSGTHKKEMSLWGRAKPDGGWYVETGLGMGDTLRVASEKQAYTLSDSGTYLAQRDNLNLKRLSGSEQILKNPYSIMAVNPEQFSKVNFDGAKRLITYVTSPEVQEVIGAFGKDEYGQALFAPDLLD